MRSPSLTINLNPRYKTLDVPIIETNKIQIISRPPTSIEPRIKTRQSLKNIDLIIQF